MKCILRAITARTVPARPADPTPPVNISLTQQVRSNWVKKSDQLPVAKDLPRMFPFMSITKDGGEIWKKLGEHQIKQSKEQALKEFLLLLTQHLKESDVGRRIDLRFFDIIPDGASDKGIQLPPQLDKLFTQVVGEEAGLTGVVKCINQVVVVPAVMALRMHFMKNKINYKDCRGQWNVNISIESEKIVITHMKWEETVPKKFEFCWHLSIHLNVTATEIINAYLRIMEIKFVDENVTEQQKKQLYEAIKEFYTPAE